jgi:hypothetical protein
MEDGTHAVRPAAGAVTLAAHGREEAPHDGQSRQGQGDRMVAALKPIVADPLWERVYITDTCWLWTGSRTPDGYGRMHRNGDLVYVHRFVAEATYGQSVTGMKVCHRCDNPPCARPDHLFIGTQADNMRDRDQKGRGVIAAVGEDNPSARLTESQVLELRTSKKSWPEIKEIAERLNVTPMSVWNAATGRTWKHLPMGVQS